MSSRVMDLFRRKSGFKTYPHLKQFIYVTLKFKNNKCCKLNRNCFYNTFTWKPNLVSAVLLFIVEIASRVYF